MQIIFFTLITICFIGGTVCIVLLQLGVLNGVYKWLLWLLLGAMVGLWLLNRFITKIQIKTKDFGKQQTKLTGIVSRKHCTVEEEMSIWKGADFLYSIEVNGTSFRIGRDTFNQLDEGDEVCVSYSPNSGIVTGIDITKKVDRDTARQRAEAKREEAMKRFKQRYEENRRKR